MSAAVYPPNPIFRSPGERAVFEALLPQLADDDVVFANLEITDPVEGDIEIDLAILLKDHGLVVVEVKGAHIAHNGIDWIQSGCDAHGLLRSRTATLLILAIQRCRSLKSCRRVNFQKCSRR